MQNQSNRRFQQEESPFARFCGQLVDAKKSFMKEIEHSISAFYHADPVHSLPDLETRQPIERCKTASIHSFPATPRNTGESGGG